MEPWSMAALAPGAWLATFAVLLVACCRRWLDPIPWRVALVWAAPIAILLGPVLVGGKVLLPLGHLVHYAPHQRLPRPDPPTHDIQGDLVTEIQPWRVQVRRALVARRWPLWNAHAGAGMGLLADPQAQALQPLALATLVVSDPAAPGLLAALRVLAALSGMYLLLRRQGLGEPAALFGSLAHGLGAPLLMWLGWPLANALALLPWPLYAVTRCEQVGGRRDWLLLVLTLAALLLGGHPEMVLYATALVVGFLGAAGWRRRSSRHALAFVARGAAALLLAAALAAPALWPARALLEQSERAAVLRATVVPLPWSETGLALWRGVTEPEALGRWGRRLAGRARSLLTARAGGDFDTPWREGSFVADGANFNPAPVLLLAAAGLFGARRRLLGERLMQAVLAVTLLLAAQPEGLVPVAARLGLLGGGFVEKHPRMLLLATFALAYLAACEADRWARGERRAAVAGAASAAIGGAIAWVYLAHPRPALSGPLGLSAHPVTLELLALAAAVLALLLIPRSSVDGRHRLAVAACALVVAVELVGLLRVAVRPAPARLYYPEVAPIRFLQQRLGSARFVGAGEALKPNFGQVYGVNDLRIHGPSRPIAHDQALHPLWADPQRGLGTYFLLAGFEHPLYDLLGARYVLAPPNTPLQLQPVFRRRTGWVYERPRWLPRLFLPRGVVTVPRADVAVLAARNRSFADRTLLVSDGEAPARRWRSRRRGIALEGLELREPERVAARAGLTERRLLASSIFQDGGWRLLANGRPLPLRLANGPFVAAWLPAGRQRVELVYRPPGFLPGCVLAALALGTIACASLRPPGSIGRRGGSPRRAGG
jgi:hypothetical protein